MLRTARSGLWIGLLVLLPTLSLATDLAPAAMESPRIEVVSATAGGLTLDFELPALSLESVTFEGEEFRSVTIPGGGLEGAVGEPALPVYGRLLALPDGMSARVRAIPLEEERIADVRPLPMQSGKDEKGFAYDRNAYTAARIADREEDALVRVGSPGILRDLRVVDLVIRPVSYDAASGGLRVARRLQVEVEFVPDGAATDRPIDQPSIPSSYRELYEELVVNFPETSLASASVPGTYLIICPDNATIISTLQALIEWRTRKGMPTLLATTTQTGTSASAIKSYIQGVYNDPSTALEYVALVGDASGSYAIPTWYETTSGYGGEGDLPYSQLAGGDVLPDVHVGRLSIDSPTTLGYIVDKVVGYESTPYVAEPGWFERSCIVGDPSSSGYSCVEAGRWYSLRLDDIGFAEADTIFNSPWTSQMATALNRGDAVFTYRGWLGMSGWSNANTYLLTNAWKMPFAIIVTCDTGSFASGTSRSEGFLRAWNSTSAVPRGAVGAIGMSTIGTHTRYNNCLYYGIGRGLLQEGQTTMGAALTRGCVELYLNYNSNEPSTVLVWSHWANLMGDPGVDVWTSYPEALDVTHPASLAVGANSMSVSVSESSAPVEGALVCLWKGSETYVVGTTDAGGEIRLPITPATAGEILLTVSKHDKQPYLATVPVGASVRYVGFADKTIDDDDLDESTGNGDGLVNPGETIELPVQLENFGFQTATGVTATLSCASPCARVVDATEDYGDIAGGASVWCPDDFVVSIEPDCAHGHRIPFLLDVASGPTHWSSLIELDVTSAALVAQGTTVVDGGNARLDPGETVELSVDLRNDGGAEATATTAALTSLGSYVTVGDPSGSYGTIGIGGSAENTGDRFTISASSGVYEGYVASFELVTTFSGGIVDTVPFSLAIGNRTSDDPVGPDMYGYLAYDNTDTAYPESPVFSWVELDPAYIGDGTEIILGDSGGYADKSVTLTLPFAFSYYGETFTEATICSNGWLAMGRTPLISYRNWTIPGAGGPNGMLAPFWDNLYQVTGSKAFQKYDAANHRWIVEWSRFRNDYNSATETFEIILYDPAHHPTDTGDGIIVFQYQQVTVTDPVEGYVTVGIESPDQLDGVLYTYFNRYSVGAATLVGGRAIKFLPVVEGPVGTLAGHVFNATNGDSPVANTQIEVIGASRIFTSGGDGSFLGTVPPGTYDVAASHVSFAPDTAYGVSIVEAEATDLDFHLDDIAGPIITTTEHPWTEDTTGPYDVPVTVEEYSDLDEATLHYSVDGGAYVPVALTPQGGDDYLAQIPGQPTGSAVRYWVYARDGLGLETTDPPGAPGETFWFAVAEIEEVFVDAFEAAGSWTVGAPDDDATTGVWIRAEPVGTTYSSTQIQPETDHSPDPAQICYITGNGVPGGAAGDQDVDGGKTTLFSPVFDLSHLMTASVTYWVWYSNVEGNNPGEDYWVVEVNDGGPDWVPLENTNASTGQAWVERTFVLDEYVALTDQVQFRFVASDEGGGSLVEAGVDDFLIVGTVDSFTGAGEGLVAYANSLAPPRPNPFRRGTRIAFQLAQRAPVTLAVYDVSGRRVATLVDGPVEAGPHDVQWRGRNSAGREVSSGVYFARLVTPEFSQVRRLTLIR